jgi:hypothetical protein
VNHWGEGTIFGVVIRLIQNKIIIISARGLSRKSAGPVNFSVDLGLEDLV